MREPLVDAHTGLHRPVPSRQTVAMIVSTRPVADPAALQQFILDNIPMAHAMQLRIGDYAGDSIELHAPLAINVNDKGCAFGGSLASLMTLAGWSLLELNLRQQGIAADIYVANAEIRYLAPVTTDLRVRARLDEDTCWADFFGIFERRGKARASVYCTALTGSGDACIQQARFVAKRRD